MTRDELAAELRARAEKARAEAASDRENRDYFYGVRDGLDEAASLVEALRSPARDDLAERLERDAEVTARLHTTGSNRRAADLREAAEALRASAPSEARVEELEKALTGMVAAFTTGVFQDKALSDARAALEPAPKQADPASTLAERLDKIAANRGLPSEDRADLRKAAEALLVADSRAEPIQRPDGQGVRTRAAREPATPAPKQAEEEGARAELLRQAKIAEGNARMYREDGISEAREDGKAHAYRHAATIVSQTLNPHGR